MEQEQNFFPVKKLSISITVEQDYLRVTCTGTYSLHSAKQTFLEVLDAVKSNHVSKVLMDGAAVTGKPTTMERFNYGEFVSGEYRKFAQTTGLSPRFAYVLYLPVIDPQRFGENVAVNRGMNVRIFDNFNEAYGWLNINEKHLEQQG